MEYLVFRQSLLERWKNKSFIPSEKSFISQFIYGDNDQMPSSDYNVYFDRLINEFQKFDVHFLLESFLDKTVFNNTTDYYTILGEIATLNRTELGCFKNRFELSIEKCASDDAEQPYIMYSLKNNCVFVFIPLPQSAKKYQQIALENFTFAGKYTQKAGKCVGISFFKDGEYFNINWCFMEHNWEYEEEMEKQLADNYPFRPVSERISQRYKYEQ